MAKKTTGMKCLLYILDNPIVLSETGGGKTYPASTFTTAGTTHIIGGQRNATLNRSAETIDSTAKDTVGNWTETIAGFKTWGLECEACYIADDASYEKLEDAFNKGDSVNVALKMENETIHTGLATISDFPIELPYNDLATYSLTLSGNGALTKATKSTTKTLEEE